MTGGTALGAQPGGRGGARQTEAEVGEGSSPAPGKGEWGRGRSGSSGRTSVMEMFRRTQKWHLVSVLYEELERNLEPVM